MRVIFSSASSTDARVVAVAGVMRTVDLTSTNFVVASITIGTILSSTFVVDKRVVVVITAAAYALNGAAVSPASHAAERVVAVGVMGTVDPTFTNSIDAFTKRRIAIVSAAGIAVAPTFIADERVVAVAPITNGVFILCVSAVNELVIVTVVAACATNGIAILPATFVSEYVIAVAASTMIGELLAGNGLTIPCASIADERVVFVCEMSAVDHTFPNTVIAITAMDVTTSFTVFAAAVIATASTSTNAIDLVSSYAVVGTKRKTRG